MEKEKALAQSFNILVSIHKDLDYLGETLAFLRGSPVCISGCGNCCKQSFHVTGVSAKFIAHSVSSLPAARQEDIITRLEKWLLHDLPSVRLHFSLDGQQELDTRQRESDEVYRLWCPFLDEQYRCLIHLWRDVTCRAWGTTRPMATFCRRPLGDTETMAAVQYVGPENPLVEDIKRQTVVLHRILEADAPAFLLKGWLPYLVYVLLVPRERLATIKSQIQEIKSAPVDGHVPWILTKEDSDRFTKHGDLMLEKAIRV